MNEKYGVSTLDARYMGKPFTEVGNVGTGALWSTIHEYDLGISSLSQV